MEVKCKKVPQRTYQYLEKEHKVLCDFELWLVYIKVSRGTLSFRDIIYSRIALKNIELFENTIYRMLFKNIKFSLLEYFTI